MLQAQHSHSLSLSQECAPLNGTTLSQTYCGDFKQRDGAWSPVLMRISSSCHVVLLRDDGQRLL